VKHPRETWGSESEDIVGKLPAKMEAKKIKPGEVRNPHGRPPGATLKRQVQSLFIEMMEEPVTVNGKPSTFLNAYKQQFLRGALGDGWQAQALAQKLFQGDILDQIDASLNRSLREDSDFFAYRIARMGSDIQQRILASKKRLILLMAGRRAGKTAGIRLMFADKLGTKPGARCLYVAKKMGVGMEQVFEPLVKLLDGLGYPVETIDRVTGDFTLANGSMFSVRSNHSKDVREALRGGFYDLAVVDECQSQPQLKYLRESILDPMLEDTRGTLVMAGTGPRAAGTYWEDLWLNAPDEQTLKLNWNISQNPFIDHYEDRLAEIRAEKKLDENSSLYQREYLGKPVYDIDALVYRLNPPNYFTDADLASWIQSQPAADIAFTAGLDYGFSDSDAIGIICHSTHKPERFLVWEYKQNHQGIEACAQALRAGLDYLATSPIFKDLPSRSLYFFADSGGGGKKISYEIATHYQLPVMDAYKVDKIAAIELLQQEIRQGSFRVRKGGEFDQEAVRIVFERDDNDRIIKVIDDSTYHPDLGDAILYAMRPIWLTSEQRIGGGK
jgi:hypothetical protein